MNCRSCNKELSYTFIDLGSSPPSNSYLIMEDLKSPEKWYPLKVKVCNECWLTQTEDFVGATDMFSDDYAYFSSYSTSWLNHAKAFVEKMVVNFSLTKKSMVAEIAANDGYLLQYVKKASIPCYGIEPTHSTAMAAREKGIEIIEDFFGEITAKKLVNDSRQVDLAIANNVLAHVPDINDFVKGFYYLLKPNGIATFEFPHLLNLVRKNQFDTIYHEHYSYISIVAIEFVFKKNGLMIFDVEELPTHGGSLRLFVQKISTGKNVLNSSVKALRDLEINSGMNSINFYEGFQKKSEKIKNDFLSFLLKAQKEGKTVAAYGAAAKGNTMMNFAGVRSDLVSYVVDKNPAKQEKYMPGSRIPILGESFLFNDKPDYVVILPWNLKEEVINQLKDIRLWGGKFVVVVPHLEIIF
jgi:SAM-dependent methyltransferase